MSVATAINALARAVLVAIAEQRHTKDPQGPIPIAEKSSEVGVSDLVDAICQERHGLRLEVIQMESAMHRAVLVFVTVAAVFAGIYWDDRVIPDDSTRAVLLLGITQVEFFMALFMLSLYVNQNVHVGYIQALEEKMNQICNTTITAWDSQITKDYLAHPRSAFFWLQMLIFLTLASVFVGAMLLISGELGRCWVVGLAILETGAVVLFAIWGLLEVGRVNRAARRALGMPKRVAPSNDR